jgi:hypothetical protein
LWKGHRIERKQREAIPVLAVSDQLWFLLIKGEVEAYGL